MPAQQRRDALGLQLWPVPRICSGAFTLCRIARFQSASRNISRLDGTFESCDRITGDVTGPYDAPGCGTAGRPPCDQMQTDARVADSSERRRRLQRMG